MKDLFSKCYSQQRQDVLREGSIYPYYRSLETGQGPEVIIGGKRKIMLGSNNYLGLTAEPEIAEAAIQAIRKYGTGTAGSRLLNGTLKMHEDFEKEIAEFLHKESAIIFPSGYQTNLGIVSGITGVGDYIIIDREAHASLYDGWKLSSARFYRFAHNDVDDLEKRLKEVPEASGCLVIVDGVYSMSGDVANLPEICKTAHKYGARVLVDDAHGLGVLGNGGRGTASFYGIEDQVDLMMGTFSKAMGSLGGFIAADARIIDYIKHASRPLIFTTSNTPADAAAACAGLHYLKKHPEKPVELMELSQFFRDELKKRNVKVKEAITPIVPIYTYDSQITLRCCCRIFDEGVYVGSVLAPAVPEGQCMLRTSVMATHTPELLTEAAEIIARVVLEEEAKAAK